MLRVAASVILVCALAACSGPPKPGTPEFAAAQHDFQVEKTKTAADQTPDWFMNPPKSDGFVYATGTATSSDLQFAVDKAVLNAKYQLADQMAGKVSGKQKDFITETAGGQASGTAEKTTSNIVADVALPAYQVVQRKVVPVDTQFRSYVLVQFAVASAPPQQVAMIPPPPPAATLQKQAEAAHRELQSDVATAKDDATAPVTQKTVVAFPIGMAPPAAAPVPQTADASAAAPAVPPEAAPEAPAVLVHPETPSAPAGEPPLPAAAPRPSVDGKTL